MGLSLAIEKKRTSRWRTLGGINSSLAKIFKKINVRRSTRESIQQSQSARSHPLVHHLLIGQRAPGFADVQHLPPRRKAAVLRQHPPAGKTNLRNAEHGPLHIKMNECC